MTSPSSFVLVLVSALVTAAASPIFPAPVHAAEAPAVSACLDGAYDLGRDSAALIFACSRVADTPGDAPTPAPVPGPAVANEGDPVTATIVFCRRDVLLKRGRCTGLAHPIDCRRTPDEMRWTCRESGTYPFEATIERDAGANIRYRFRSSFNEGERIGIPIEGGA